MYPNTNPCEKKNLFNTFMLCYIGSSLPTISMWTNIQNPLKKKKTTEF